MNGAIGLFNGKAQRRREPCWIPASRPPNTRQSALWTTGGYWFFDWRVLVLRLAGFGLATGGFWVGDWALCLQGRFLFGKTKIAALSADLSYNLRLLKNLGDG